MATAEFIQDNRGARWIGVSTLHREQPLIRQVPGSRYDTELDLWKCRPSYTACVQLSAIFGPSLEVSDALREFGRTEFTRATTRKEMATATDAPGDERLSCLQRVGAQFLVDGPTILADEMGSGKTVQACVALDALAESEFHALIVAPNSVKRSWAAHIETWTSLSAFVVAGSAKKRTATIAEFVASPRGVLVMNWEQLALHSRLAAYGNIRLSEKERTLKELNFIDFDVIVADEAHRAKNPQAKQTRALWALNAGLRWALTGTPIANHPGDLWAILRFVDPQEWPSRVEYIDRYCVQQFSPFGGTDIVGVNYQTRGEFYHLIDKYFLRRLKSEVMGRTIEKTQETRYVTLPPKHRAMYNEFRAELLVLLDNGAMAATNQLAATSRLVQLSAAPLDQDGDNFRMIDPSPKVKELLALLDDLDGDPLVVFSASKQLAYLAAAALEKSDVPFLLATGDQHEEVRAAAVERFQAGEGRVFLGTTGAISEGVTLTRAKVLCFLQRDWSMVKNLQAEDRIHRWGQHANEVTIVNIITEDTIDERVWNVYTTKQGRLDEITRDSWKKLI